MADARGAVIDNVLSHAARTGSMDQALATHGATLAPQDVTVLKSLSPNDLQNISSLQSKLGALKKAAEDNNGGVF